MYGTPCFQQKKCLDLEHSEPETRVYGQGRYRQGIWNPNMLDKKFNPE